MSYSLTDARKFGVKVVTVTQSVADLERYAKGKRRSVAFEEWRRKLSRRDRLPRGTFFKGKKGGEPLMILDEFHALATWSGRGIGGQRNALL